MQSTSQPHPSAPCPCRQQFADALPWLALALVFVFALDRWNNRRRKNNKKPSESAVGNGPEEGGKQ